MMHGFIWLYVYVTMSVSAFGVKVAQIWKSLASVRIVFSHMASTRQAGIIVPELRVAEALGGAGRRGGDSGGHGQFPSNMFKYSCRYIIGRVSYSLHPPSLLKEISANDLYTQDRRSVYACFHSFLVFYKSKKFIALWYKAFGEMY